MYTYKLEYAPLPAHKIDRLCPRGNGSMESADSTYTLIASDCVVHTEAIGCVHMVMAAWRVQTAHTRVTVPSVGVFAQALAA